MPTLTIGSHGEVVIPKAVREQLNLTKGSKVDYEFANNILTICPSIATRTRMDEDFDRVRDSYLANGISITDLMQTLEQIYTADE